MIKKIVALAISVVLSIGALVSYNVINSDAVEFGAGTGVSRTITNVSELSDLLSKIPSFEEYSANKDITDVEGKESFEGATVVETGYVSQYGNYRRAIQQLPLTDSDDDEETIYKSRIQNLRNHRLEMSFAKKAVYYHSIGTTWTAIEYYSDVLPEEGVNYSYNFYDDDFVVAYREKTDYDVEIYHSEGKTMFKINKYNTVKQTSTRIKDTENVWENADNWEFNYNKTNVVKIENDEDGEVDAMTQLTNELIDEMLKIRENNYGAWIEYPTAEEGEGEDAEPDFEGVENMTPEQQKEFVINMLVEQFAIELTNFAYQDLVTVQNAHNSNQAYLASLSSFILANAIDADYFTIKGDTYKLNADPKWIPEERGPEPDYELIREGYYDYTVRDSYLSAVGLPSYHGDGKGSNVKFDFNINSDIVSINQKVSNWTEYDRNEYETNTSIMYIDNTVVSLSKNAKIKSLNDAYVTPFEKVLTSKINSMYDQLMGGNE